MPVKDTEFYDALGVSPDASEKEIKNAFRKKAVKCHPDKHSNSTPDVKAKAEDEFKNINQAYEILSDPEKRESYDRFGKESLGNGPGPDMEDILRNFGMRMGGMGGFPFGGQQKPKSFSMPNLVAPVTLNLREIYEGKKVEFNVQRYVLKRGATPSKSDIICPQCKGQGQKTGMQQIGPGTYRQFQEKCKSCKGEGMAVKDEHFDKVNKTLRKAIPRGVIHSHQIVIPNAGHDIPACLNKNGANSKTDLVIVIKEEQQYTVPDTNLTYSRGAAGSPFNLQLSLDLTAELAICGGLKEVTFLDGSKFLVEIPKGLAFMRAHDVVVENRGLPLYGLIDTASGDNKYGDLFIKFNLSSIVLDDQDNEKVYAALTGRNMKKDRARMKSTYDSEYDEPWSIEDYGDSERLNKVNDDFREFQQTYQREKQETMRRRMNEGVDPNDGVDSDTSDDEMGGPPGCAQQ